MNQCNCVTQCLICSFSDSGMPDPDLQMPDLQMPDLQMPDLQMPQWWILFARQRETDLFMLVQAALDWRQM